MRYFVFAFLFSAQAFAYQSSLNSGGKPLTWSNNTIPFVINTNTSDLSAPTVTSIIQQSIAEWNGQTAVQIVPTNSALSEVVFKSDFSMYGPGVIGLTELTYTSGGAIQQAKVYLNDQNYTFRSSPGLYSSGEVYLGDVVTHELGHLYGLSHSEVLDSTMFYAAFPGQSTLSADDKAGIRSKYASGYGIISGTVRGGDDIGILGVHVMAFSRTTGKAVGAITTSSGAFSIKGLDLNDSYYLYTSPLKNLSSLPDQFANVQTNFCPASYVGGFFEQCGKEHEGFPQAITLTTGSSSVNVGDVSINCSLKSNEDYNYEKVQTSFSPVTIFDYAQDGRFEKAFVGNFLTKSSLAWSAYDKLNIDLTGYTQVGSGQKFLRLNFIARQFGNLLEYEMLVKKNGTLIGTYQINYSAVTQTYSTDMAALIPLDTTAASNFYEVSIRARKLSTTIALQTFAELEQFVSNQYLPYLLIASIESASGPVLDNTAILSDNAACLDAPFSYAVSNAKTLSSNSGELSKENQQQGPLSCGTTGGSSSGGGPGGNGTVLMALGFFMAVIFSSLRKTAKNFLS